MAVIARYKVELGGFTGAPGLNTLMALDVAQGTPSGTQLDEFNTQLQSMYSDLNAYYPAGNTATVLQTVDLLDVATATLVDRVVLSNVWTVTGIATGGEASRATQAKFRYRTDRILNNRFVQGGIYFGPLANNAIAEDGSLQASFRTLVTTAHDGLLDVLGPLRLAIWSQPDPNGSNGEYGYVQSVTAGERPAVLRSRRD